MKIGIITWLESAEFEDIVLQALLTEGISRVELEYRALSIDSLIDFLVNKPTSDSRFILIHDTEEINSALERELRRFPGAIRMAIEPVIGDVTVEIERIVNRALREFETSPTPRKAVHRQKNLVVVTGSTGAPGTTTITLNLGNELARSRAVELIDLNPSRRDLAFLLGAKRSSESVHLSENLAISGELSDASSALQLVDSGPIPNLESAFSDRRAPARGYVDLLERAETIIFLMTPDNNHMFELESILASLDAGRISARTIFILNQMGNTRRERSIQKRFSARVGKYESELLPFDRDSLDRAKGAYSALLDVAPRSKLRKAIGEVAVRLLE
jgi:MinD-like ATPase involved in chromosome partitioning or flagellar assembly